MCSTVIGEMNYIKQLTLFSDRCSDKEVGKMQEDFEKDLSLNKRSSRAVLGRYLKNTEKTLATAVEPEEGEDQDVD